MKNSTLFLICMAFLATVIALATHASAYCASCEEEGDWSQSASNFISGTPTSDEPIAFGPKSVRKTTSQFENKANAASSAAQAPTEELVLKRINAAPSTVSSESVTKITAVFALNGSEQTELQLTATASIKDSTGKEVGKLNMIKTAGNEYSCDWAASVQAGIYIVDIAASSLQGSANFNNALNIEVVGSANATI